MNTIKNTVQRAIDPRKAGGATYSRSLRAQEGSGLPVPPRELRAGNGTSEREYLDSGREDCETMRKLLAASGAPVEDAGRILDLGVAEGRMIRHLADLAPDVQVWGCDIRADAIRWCQDNMSPPFWFATITDDPHLPFEAGSFGLAYCGSLFTPAAANPGAWYADLHRVIRPGGRLLLSADDPDAVSQRLSYGWQLCSATPEGRWHRMLMLLERV